MQIKTGEDLIDVVADCEIVSTRIFDWPREAVFRA
jgi:hypothetical protein